MRSCEVAELDQATELMHEFTITATPPATPSSFLSARDPTDQFFPDLFPDFSGFFRIVLEVFRGFCGGHLSAMYTGGHLPARFTKQEREEEVAEKEDAPSSVVEAPENGLPSVLVTNDDGINAPGLRTLVAALIEDGSCNVFVCAPDS